MRLRGLSPLAATLSTPIAAPMIAGMRLRKGSAASGRGAASLLGKALATARAAGAAGTVVVRADSAFYAGAVISTARRGGARFSVTVTMNPLIRAAIAPIAEDACIPMHYPEAVEDPDTGELISDAEVAETTYTAFAGTQHAITARPVVRRVKDKNTTDALFPVWRHHAFFTDTTLSTVDADRTPPARDHRASFRRPHRRPRWHTCPPDTSRPTPPGRSARPSPTIYCAPRAASPASFTPKPAGPTLRRHLITIPARLACPQGKPVPTCPNTGPGNTPSERFTMQLPAHLPPDQH